MKLPASLSWSDKIAYLAWELRQRGGSEGWPVEHVLEPGWYRRIIRLPRGMVLIGRKHREGHICRLLEGKVWHITPQGSVVVEAPFTMVSQPGYQMVIYTLTDIVGESVHVREDSETDVQALELAAFEPEDEVLLRGKKLASNLKLLEVA